MTWSKVGLVILPITYWFLSLPGFTTIAPAAEIQMQVQAVPPPSALSPTGKLLTIEDAVRIGLDNHPRGKAANERIGSQQAVLGQQMAAYYPSITLNNNYRTTNASSSTSISQGSSPTVNSQTNFSYTIYNFGKREGTVQAARDTLSAVQQDYATTNQD